jgi:hypothetical protein
LRQRALSSFPFFLSGGLKLVYDLLLYRGFRNLKPPQEIQERLGEGEKYWLIFDGRARAFLAGRLG